MHGGEWRACPSPEGEDDRGPHHQEDDGPGDGEDDGVGRHDAGVDSPQPGDGSSDVPLAPVVGHAVVRAHPSYGVEQDPDGEGADSKHSSDGQVRFLTDGDDPAADLVNRRVGRFWRIPRARRRSWAPASSPPWTISLWVTLPPVMMGQQVCRVSPRSTPAASWSMTSVRDWSTISGFELIRYRYQ